ncbi:uncharacterized protein BO87DRAFT_97726 [Aspergillus neoniger CBS 115656]|uniref:Uncharacterized protein n=1 Tax=Aspergillus neoniger (strain CBS 115656) TaxID=1448310 RepID=A0A318YK07_ASPNB|nr:hypothetical protein BO87DRAFT_97726 [Aspergillus neoniger CBS 115656]PYH32760.1 hypothetical protein BO87DRAFT_97726 [Aspergillus neoniger CBS 115656]
MPGLARAKIKELSKRATDGLYSRSDPCIWVRVHTCKLSRSGKYPLAAYVRLEAIYEFCLYLACLLACQPASQLPTYSPTVRTQAAYLLALARGLGLFNSIRVYSGFIEEPIKQH